MFRKLLLILALLAIPIFGMVFWHSPNIPKATLNTTLKPFDEAGKKALENIQTLPALAFTEDNDNFLLSDSKKSGMKITFANRKDENTLSENPNDPEEDKIQLSFPKKDGEPLTVQLSKEKTIAITSRNSRGGEWELLPTDNLQLTTGNGGTGEQELGDQELGIRNKELREQELRIKNKELGMGAGTDAGAGENEKKYLLYSSEEGRRRDLYSYNTDGASGEKYLKHWVLYQHGLGKELESYHFENAKLKRNEDGSVGVFFVSKSQIDTEKAKTEADPKLLERAQNFLKEELGEDALEGKPQSNTPDIVIPAPFFYDKTGKKITAIWTVSEDGKTLSVDISAKPEDYPLALDPTLGFTAPGVTNSGSVITGEGVNNSFGVSLAIGDLNADGKTDLVVGAYQCGRTYIFYGGSIITENARGADVIITGEGTGNYFGYSLTTGDLNADGKTDLVVGAYYWNADGTGRTYIFYNGSITTENASGADVIITGEGISSFFSTSLATGDLNADGKTDLAVGAWLWNGGDGTGRAYIFYNGSITNKNASAADVIITGEGIGSLFSTSLATGDLNADGKTDLAVGAYGWTTSTGRTYIFYNGSITTKNASGADVIITGEGTDNYFGYSLTTGDLNADGKIDLIVGASKWNNNFTGRAYIFYNGSITTKNASAADVIITGEGTDNRFGWSLATGDLNADGKTDLAVGAYYWNNNTTGRVYIFYNGSITTENASGADVIITGEGTNNNFGTSLATGDFNADGKIDLVVGANKWNNNLTGRVYVFYSQNGQVNTNTIMTGEGTNNDFGNSLATGDLNADGKTDLIVGANGITTNTGRAYIFYNGSIATKNASGADVIITGEGTNNNFGASLAIGDLNADGKTDLAVGASGWTTNTGRAYIFYNGSIATKNASAADVIITGEGTNNYFGASLATGDLNADGKTDLIAGANGITTNTGRAYIFYNGSITTKNASGADAIITGEGTNNWFSFSLATGDLNADGKVDLIAGAILWNNNGTGRAYIFYNGSITTENASSADVIITGEGTNNYFGQSLVTSDLNADGKTDLAVGAGGITTNTGRAYIFYNGSITTKNASAADVIITGEGTNNNFGTFFATGDLNSDGKTDLAVGAYGITTNTGRAYIFYNGSITTENASGADVVITGEGTNNSFSYPLATGDLNADGKTDLVVGAYYWNNNQTGRVYLYETRDNFSWKPVPVATPTSVGEFRTGISGATGQEMKIHGEVGSGENFGISLATGDLNADGKTDLIVGAYAYATSTGRTYIFYNDGSMTTTANSADVIITGEGTNNFFGFSLTTSDLNLDGKIDLVVGASKWDNNYTGRAYIFYNGSITTENASSADVIITGEGTNNFFGRSFTTGDLNADGKTDLVVGAYRWNNNYTGRAYIFYNGSITTENASGADVIITGEGISNRFGFSLVTGDLNADGKTDLAVGAYQWNNNYTGRVYIFYNGSIITENASGADVIITGEGTDNDFSYSLSTGDLNADGKTDLVVGAYGWNNTGTGRAYIFYNGSITTENASGADVIITGEGTNNSFGVSLVTGDLNADGKIDLIVDADYWNNNGTGRAYIFYNGSITTENASGADIIITGEGTNNDFGYSLAIGDLNVDGKTDLVVGAYGKRSNDGAVYLYTMGDSTITGEGTNNSFGNFLATGDLNADGKTDLVVGAPWWNGNGTGRAYIFYNGSIITKNASAADVIITGEGTNNWFSFSLATGDLNADGKTDLVVGAGGWNGNGTGRAYIFYNGSITTENASGADVIITGETKSSLGYTLATGDLNADGKTDLVVGAYWWNNNYTGRVYIFYNGSITTENASAADVIITGEGTNNSFGYSLATSDLNADGKIDLVVGATRWNNNYTGRVYIFYNGSITTENASAADVIITGEGTDNYFGASFATGDLNVDGKIDLAVGAYGITTNTGRAYIFYNGSITTENASGADVVITGEGTNNSFSYPLATGDLNADGKTDLVIGADNWNNNGTGRAYIFYNGSITTENASGADVIITGEGTNNSFGISLTTGDLNIDGKTDLVVGAYQWNNNSTGRVYVIYTEAYATEVGSKAKLRGAGKLKGSAKFR